MLDRTIEELPEVGGILHLEHFNFEIPDHDMATMFFMNGLGLTRDPFRRTDETNMGVNIGLQQFHLPRRGKGTFPFPGCIGLILPDLRVVRARLERLQRLGKFKRTKFDIRDGDDDVLEVVSPFGIDMRLHRAGTLPFLRPLGMPYVDIFVRPGLSKPIGQFYRKLMNAVVGYRKIGGDASAVVTMGAYQWVRFREREIDDYDLHNFHISYYAANYNQIRRRVMKRDPSIGGGSRQLFFFPELFDLKTDEPILKFIQELRSVYHRDFMRPLVNRWPIDWEPFSDQADILADIGVAAGGVRA